MEIISISFTLGKAGALHGANIKHNNRKYTAVNANDKKSTENVFFQQQDVRDSYHQLFDRALQEYNEKQKKNDRIILDYYLHMAESKREEAFYEVVMQFGDFATAPCGSERGEQAKQMLESYMREFQNHLQGILHMLLTW